MFLSECRDLTAQIVGRSSSNLSRSQRNLGHFDWLDFYWCKICSCMATNSIETFLNITRDTFLYTIPFYKLEGIATPASKTCLQTSKHTNKLVHGTQIVELRIEIVFQYCMLCYVYLIWIYGCHLDISNSCLIMTIFLF